MSHSDRSGSSAQDKLKLLEALKRLHEAGVPILDDQRGRPRLTDLGWQASTAAATDRGAADTVSDGNFELEDQVGADPYNKPI